MPSHFEDRVYRLTSQVPQGKVTTYGEIGRALGCNSGRAVGQALKRNPYAPIVPCHRVVCANLSLGGFFGSTGKSSLNKKRALLESEGVIFNGDRVSRICFFQFQ